MNIVAPIDNHIGHIITTPGVSPNTILTNELQNPRYSHRKSGPSQAGNFKVFGTLFLPTMCISMLRTNRKTDAPQNTKTIVAIDAIACAMD